MFVSTYTTMAKKNKPTRSVDEMVRCFSGNGLVSISRHSFDSSQMDYATQTDVPEFRSCSNMLCYSDSPVLSHPNLDTRLSMSNEDMKPIRANRSTDNDCYSDDWNSAHARASAYSAMSGFEDNIRMGSYTQSYQTNYHQNPHHSSPGQQLQQYPHQHPNPHHQHHPVPPLHNIEHHSSPELSSNHYTKNSYHPSMSYISNSTHFSQMSRASSSGSSSSSSSTPSFSPNHFYSSHSSLGIIFCSCSRKLFLSVHQAHTHNNNISTNIPLTFEPSTMVVGMVFRLANKNKLRKKTKEMANITTAQLIIHWSQG